MSPNLKALEVTATSYEAALEVFNARAALLRSEYSLEYHTALREAAEACRSLYLDFCRLAGAKTAGTTGLFAELDSLTLEITPRQRAEAITRLGQSLEHYQRQIKQVIQDIRAS